MHKKNALIKLNYEDFLGEIKAKINSARICAYRVLNKELIKLYWEIGKSIVEKQEKFGWGKSVVERLSLDLIRDCKNINGFSANNLWRMRNFYQTYKKQPKLAQLVQEIPWGQNIVVMQRIKSVKLKEYYLKKIVEMGWSRNVLIHQIDVEAHKQGEIKKMHNFARALPMHLSAQADLAMKDTYLLDFIDAEKPILERTMERRLLTELKKFISELGMGFCFVGSQYPLSLNDKEYFIDLLFFHRALHCLVVFELKIGEFKPEYAGKMNFYLNLLDDTIRLPGENPTIGVILCKDRNRIEVEYALRGIQKPIGVSAYKLSKKLPKKLNQSFPTPEEFKEGLRQFKEY